MNYKEYLQYKKDKHAQCLAWYNQNIKKVTLRTLINTIKSLKNNNIDYYSYYKSILLHNNHDYLFCNPYKCKPSFCTNYNVLQFLVLKHLIKKHGYKLTPLKNKYIQHDDFSFCTYNYILSK